MPFIKGKLRKPIDEHLNGLLDFFLSIKKREDVDPCMSYIILRLLDEVYGNDVRAMIRAIGVLEETKLTYYNMKFAPTEQLILLKRWLNPNGV